jgi:hypothetical protein
MRMQALQQDQLSYSLVRKLVQIWHELTAKVSVRLQQRAKLKQCSPGGHAAKRLGIYNLAPTCRYCGVQFDAVTTVPDSWQ